MLLDYCGYCGIAGIAGIADFAVCRGLRTPFAQSAEEEKLGSGLSLGQPSPWVSPLLGSALSLGQPSPWVRPLLGPALSLGQATSHGSPALVLQPQPARFASQVLLRRGPLVELQQPQLTGMGLIQTLRKKLNCKVAIFNTLSATDDCVKSN